MSCQISIFANKPICGNTEADQAKPAEPGLNKVLLGIHIVAF